MHALAGRVNPERRQRSNPRVVKRKVLKWAAKRQCHYGVKQTEYPQSIRVQTLN